MVPSDVPIVSQLDSDCFTTAWSEQAYSGELRHCNAHYYVAEVESEIIGFGGMWIILDEMCVNRLAVASQFRRHGVGEAILHHMMNEAVLNGVTAATLEVRATNDAAISLYIKYGFVSEGLRKGYYTDCGDDALIMWNRHLGE